jgi:Tol biopolymer transport system component
MLAAPGAHAAFPGANGKIAFSTGDIQTMNPDGTGVASLTGDSFMDEHPAWSPDGTKLAFQRSGFGESDIYVINADGTGLTRLTNNPARDVDPAWSPDGTKIVFSSDRNELDPTGCGTVSSCNFEIYVMNADGTGQTRLTNAAFVDREPAWSPDGTRIAFQSDRDDPNVPSCSSCNFEIYVMNADGTGQTRLTFSDPGGTGGVRDVEPNWSPDGTRIAFSSDRECGSAGFRCVADVFVMNSDGSAQTRITSLDGVSDTDPAWSPDGQKMAVNAVSCGPSPSSGCVDFIYTMNADGSGSSGALGSVPAGQPDWQPLPTSSPGPQPGDYKNASQFCKAERDYLGRAAFSQKYGATHAFKNCRRG